MSILYIRILFFCLIPIGIFILIKGIQILSKAFNGKVLLDMPYLQKGGTFSIAEAGHFSVWLKGKTYRSYKHIPFDKSMVRIYNELTGAKIPLNYSFASPQTNNFSTGRIERYRFRAPAGNYKIEIKDAGIVPGTESSRTNIIPLQQGKIAEYTVQIRTSPSQVITFLAIPMAILGFGCTVGGVILGLVAEQIFKP